MTALSFPSGEYAIIRFPNVRPWWRGAGAGLIWTGIVGIVIAALLGWNYIVTASLGPDDSPARVTLIAFAMSIFIGAIVAILLGCKERTDDRARRKAQAELLAKLDANAAAIVAAQGRVDLVWDEMLGEVGRAVGVHSGKLAELVGQRLGQMEQRVVTVGELVGRRLDEIEQQMDEQDERLAGLRARLDGAEEAMVTVACTLAPAQRGNGQIPTGLDPEVVELARQISDRLRGDGGAGS
ncbi:MAG TPA: hypothetical protein VGW74_15655 [Propionibacteriaceae bacterium]|nr:hypothetical protein [Propionibacteriaceae bacterium]